MSRVDLAAQRLAKALEYLEDSAESAARTNALPRDVGARIKSLEGEREALLARVAALEEDLAALNGVTEQVESRLDGAIGEIRAALSR